MLSPNARNLVRDSRGIGVVTVIVNEHEAAVAAASVAVHRTVLAPTANAEPDECVQVTRMGSTPPDVVGALNVTGTAAPVGEATLTFAGQIIVSDGRGSAGVSGGVARGSCIGVGAVGDEHAAAANRAATIAPSALRRVRYNLDDSDIRGTKIVLRADQRGANS
jgi:hypothetical protein